MCAGIGLSLGRFCSRELVSARLKQYWQSTSLMGIEPMPEKSGSSQLTPARGIADGRLANNSQARAIAASAAAE